MPILKISKRDPIAALSPQKKKILVSMVLLYDTLIWDHLNLLKTKIRFSVNFQLIVLVPITRLREKKKKKKKIWIADESDKSSY